MGKRFTRTISSLLALALAASFAVMPAWAAEIDEEALYAVDGTAATALIEGKIEEPAEEAAATTTEETGEENAVTLMELDEELIEAPVADYDALLNNINNAIERYVVRKAQGGTAGITQADDRKCARMVAEIAVAKLSEEQAIDYTERFASVNSIDGFIALYSEMVTDSGIYDSTVETATDGSFNRMDSSRWVHADDGLAIYYTYSTQNGLAIPEVGVPYSSTGAVDLTDEQLRQVCRLLEAGYPLDMYGLSKYAEGYSAAVQAYFTQDVLFMLLGQAPTPKPDEPVYPYIQALYDYAVGDDVLEPINKVTITFDDKIELKYSEETNDYRATVALHVTGTADMVKIESVPEGTKLFYQADTSKPVELKVGNTIDPAGILTMVTDGVAPITGSLRASFVSYHVVNTEIANFVSGKLLLTIQKDGAAVHTPLMGYQVEAVPGETELSSISLIGPENPEQFLLTVNYVNEQGTKLADAETTHITKNEKYDATELANKAIDGYTIKSTAGDVTGTVTGDVTITVTYAAITDEMPPVTPEEPENPDNGGNNGGNNGGGNTDRPTTPEQPEIEIPEEQPPLADQPEIEIPEDETPLAPQPEVTPDLPKAEDVIIVDPEVPMGNLPQTGTTRGTETLAVLGGLALTLSMAAAGFTVALTKKKEH